MCDGNRWWHERLQNRTRVPRKIALLVGHSETEARLLVLFTAPLPVIGGMSRPCCPDVVQGLV